MAITFDSNQSVKNPSSIKQSEQRTSVKPTIGVPHKKQQDIHFGNNSFSGTDMVAVMSISNIEGISGTYVLGSLQTLTYSTHMQRSPIRSIGNVNAKDYVMGPRTIAGSLVFAVFDRHFAYAAMEDIKGSNEGFHFLADELPPFDITITMANEYGKKAKLVIYGVRLVNEGQVMSVNDIFTENTYQFVAHDLDYLSDQNGNVGGNFVHEDIKHRPDYVTDAIEVDLDDLDTTTSQTTNYTQYINVNVKTTNAQVTPEASYDGKASITLDREVLDGSIVVTSTADESIVASVEIKSDSQWPYVCSLPKGDYVAVYQDKNENLSKPTAFYIGETTVNKKKPFPPIQIFEDKVSNGTTTVAVKIIDAIGKGIRYAPKSQPNNWKEAIVKNKIAFVDNLQEFTTYLFQATDGPIYSDSLEIHIDGVLNALFSDFYNHIMVNAHKIDHATYLAFNKIWAEALRARDEHKVLSVAGAIQKAKDKNSETLTKAYYTYYIKEAIAFEKEIHDFRNLALSIQAPVLIDMPTSLLEFSRQAKRLKVTFDNGEPPKIWESHSFTTHGDKYRFRVRSSTGICTATVIGSDGSTESPPLEFVTFSAQDIENLLEEKVTLEQLIDSLKQELIFSDGKWINNSLTETEKDNLTEEALNDSKLVLEGIGQPIVTEMTDKLVRVRTQIPTTKHKEYFLCICKSSDISDTALHKKIPISEKTDWHVLYASKYGFITGERYSLWIENNSNLIASHTTSFCFNQENSPQTDARDTYLANKVKNVLAMDYNKNQVDSYMEDGFNPIVAFDGILKSNCSLPNSTAYKGDAVLDVARAKHKWLYGPDNENILQDPPKYKYTINLRQGYITGLMTNNSTVHVQLDWYAEHGGEQCNFSDSYPVEYPFTKFVNRHIEGDMLALVIHYKSHNRTDATEPIVIDFVSQKHYSKLKNVEVMYP